MFILPFFTLGLASAALATPLKRAQALTVTIAAPSTSVASINDLTLTAVVKNAGTEDLKILKYGTVLDQLPTRSFTVTKDGEKVAFQGVAMQVQLSAADDSAYTVIPAGEEVTVTHKVAELFDFASAGVGTFKFEANSLFQVTDTAERKSTVDALDKIEIASSAVEVAVTHDVAKRDLTVLDKRAVVSCSSSTQAAFISAAYSEAKSLASGAAAYINAGTSTLYTAYYSTNSRTTVANRFTAVANENSSSRTLNCSDPYGVCDGNVIAYTVIATTNIYFCSIFYNEVASSALCSGTTVASRNIRGGTVLHELTHAVDGTDDVTYGCSADQALSTSQKLANADNYNCFSTQVYANAC